MNTRLLAMLRCPVSHQKLRVLNSAELDQLNASIDSSGISNLDGEVLDSPLEAALITANISTIYPVIDGIPVMLEGKSIANSLLDKPINKKI